MPEIIKKGASLNDYLDYIKDTGDFPGGMRPAEYFFDAWNNAGLVPNQLNGDRFCGGRYVLEHFFNFVGITELFDESLFCLSKELNLLNLPRWSLRGKSDRPSLSDINPDIIRKIDKLTEIDRELYCLFREKFEVKYKDEIKYFRNNIRSLRRYYDEQEDTLIFPS